MVVSANKRVLIAMSGGVDSSVCALLAKRAGYDVAGVTCRMFDPAAVSAPDCAQAEADVYDARQACELLGIPHHTVDCKKPFGECVIQKFVDSYLEGLTPNPCIECNRHVKFGALQETRAGLGFDMLATGHYARVEFDEEVGRWTLLRAVHAEKDQSYMLCRLTQDQLARSMFPLGSLAKEEVRRLAADAGLSSAHRSDSQDICFVPNGDYATFVERWSGCHPERGPIVDASGKVLGEHSGLLHYTIGQRKGIGIGGGGPLYVTGKDPAANTLVVGPREELSTCVVTASDVNFVSIPEVPELRASAKVSYRQTPQPATAVYDGNVLQVRFDDPILRPAPGQTVALYDPDAGERVLAGAVIRQNS